MLPTLLRHDEIARYDSGVLYTLDRRCYPLSKQYVAMHSVKEVAKAIKDMVTQGGGPLELSLKALLLARDRGESLEEAVSILSSTRPTNRSMANTLSLALERVKCGEDLEEVISSILKDYDDAYDRMSDYGSSLIKDGYGILTTCFAEHSFLLSVKKAEEAGKKVRVYVPETRPYLQGAKLTLPSLLEMNVESYLITDAMPAFFMREKKIDIYMSASDAYLPDGSISNKIGTLENAIAAKYYGIPYYAFSLRSSYNEDIRIEYRSQSEIIYIDGKPITLPEAKAIYPAFDIIEPSLISGIITKDGIK